MTDPLTRLHDAYAKVKFFPERSPTGWIDLIALRNAAAEVLTTLQIMLREAEVRGIRRAADEIRQIASHADVPGGNFIPDRFDEGVHVAAAMVDDLASAIERGQT